MLLIGRQCGILFKPLEIRLSGDFITVIKVLNRLVAFHNLHHPTVASDDC